MASGVQLTAEEAAELDATEVFPEYELCINNDSCVRVSSADAYAQLPLGVLQLIFVAFPQDGLQWLKCGHWLHSVCADEAMEMNNLKDVAELRCPYCKKRGCEIRHKCLEWHMILSGISLHDRHKASDA